MKKVIIAVVVILALGGIYVWSLYNGLVSASEGVDNQWAQVETQYQRRFDLIPNLVESVKGIMNQEQKVFGDLAAARASYSGATTANTKAAAATGVESALGRLLAVVENYPQLNSSQNVRDLMIGLEGTENRISVERKNYNDKVQLFNVMIKRVPANLFASAFGFAERAYFEAAAGTEVAPAVKL